MKERVQKLMAQAGLASRRESEKLIQEGRVRVNGKVVGLGDKADPDTDVIEVDGLKIKPKDVKKVYYSVYKPVNVLSTNSANHADERSVVRDLIPYEGHLFTIGRLDAESEGLMVLTNDGDLTNKLAHPRYEHTKTYKVVVYGQPSNAVLEEWQNGVWLEEGKTAPCYIWVMEKTKETTTLRIVMIEGKKRQIRRIAAKLGHPVKKLMRTHIGQLGIGTLRRGDWIRLTDEEVHYLTQPAPELSIIRKRRRMLREQKYKKSASKPETPKRDKPSRRDEARKKPSPRHHK